MRLLRARAARWSAGLLAAAGLLAGPLAGPALAQANGQTQAPGLPILEVIAIYVCIPLGLFALITVLVVLPALLHRPRYRPGRPWQHDPVWFAGPPGPEGALRAAVPALQTRGGVGADW